MISCELRLFIYSRERRKQLDVVVMPKGTRDPHVIWNERLARRNRLGLRRNGGRRSDGRWPNELRNKNRLTHPRDWKSRGRGQRGEINNRVRRIGRQRDRDRDNGPAKWHIPIKISRQMSVYMTKGEVKVEIVSVAGVWLGLGR